MKDFIFFATADWDTLYWTNKQHMAIEFARLGHRILYVESVGLRKPKITSSVDWKRIFFRFFRGIRTPKKVDPHTNIWILSPLVLPFSQGNKWIKSFNQSVMKWQIKFFLKQYKFSNPLIWTYHPFILDVISNLNLRNKLIYHCVDDLSAVPGIDKFSYNVEEKRLLKKADIVFATSKYLKKKCLQHNKNTYYFANVVDFEHFSLDSKFRDIPKDLVEIPEPRIVIAGALSEFKINFKLLHKIITNNHQYSFVFIGNEIEGQSNKLLKKYPTSKILFSWAIKHIKICLITSKKCKLHLCQLKKNSYTKSMSPMKLNEYIASGLPVISTDLNFSKEYKHTKEIVIITNYNKFPDVCTKLLKHGKISTVNARKIVGKNTWQERADKMFKIINMKAINF